MIDDTTHWTQRPERSNLLMLRLMAWVSLRLGRRVSRSLLYGIAAYFLLLAPSARRSSKQYLRRVYPSRRVGWRLQFRHFLAFASVIHDRIYLVNDRFDLFDIRVQGDGLVREVLAQGRGAFMLGGHLGSFEVLRAVGQQQPGLRLAMAMFEENARKINALLQAINPAVHSHIVPLGKVDSMIAVHDLLESGAVVGILADRSLGSTGTRTLSFLGAPAQLPVGPFRMAAILRRPVLFMTGLYGGGKRYDIHFEMVADFSQIPAGGREAAVQTAMECYAALLEKYCHVAPTNWFNFFDFWQPPAAPHPSP